MQTWKIDELEAEPHKPQILSSTEAARLIVIELPAGESLEDHEVHERAWLVVVTGEVSITPLGSDAGEQPAAAVGGPGMLVEFEPSERHRVDARTDSRFLLLLAPWPGAGHPGAMTLEEKAGVRELAARLRAED